MSADRRSDAADPLPLVRSAQPGRIHLRRRRDAEAARAATRRTPAWVDYVYLRDNPRGPHDELWLHSAGCRRWFKVRRDTRTHDILAQRARRAISRCPGRRARDASRSASPTGGIIDRAQTARLHVRRRALRGLCRRHARLGAARQRRASRRPQLQVSPAARHLQRRRRGAERAGAARAAARATEPNTRATQVELYDGLVAASQNRWPSLRFDVGAINDVVVARCSRPASTTRRSCGRRRRSWWLATSTSIRRAAGMGRAADASPIPITTSISYAHCDVLVVGGGAAGSRRRARRGAQRRARDRCATRGGARRRAAAARPRRSTTRRRRHGSPRRSPSCAAMPDVTLLPRTTAFGYYDHNLVGLVERVADHLAAPPAHAPRQRLWQVRAQAGRARDRRASSARIVFANNDLPGHDARRRGAHLCQRIRRAARASRAVVFTNNDSAYATALALHARRRRDRRRSSTRGRAATARRLPQRARAAGMPIIAGHARSSRAHGRLRVTGVDVAPLGGGGHHGDDRLRSRLRLGRLEPDACICTRRRAARCATTRRSPPSCPAPSPQADRSAGAANGEFALADGLADGHRGPAPRRRRLRASAAAPRRPRRDWPRESAAALQPLWSVPSRRQRQALRRPAERRDRRRHRARRARRLPLGRASEALHDARHGHRPGQDQQRHRPCACSPSCSARPIPAVGTTTFRPPYTPVTLGAFAGRDAGRARRADAPHRDARLARGARRALRQRRAVEAPALVSAARRDGGRRGDRPRGAATCAATSASSTSRRSARSSCRAATSPSSSIASTSTAGTRSPSAAAATA